MTVAFVGRKFADIFKALNAVLVQFVHAGIEWGCNTKDPQSEIADHGFVSEGEEDVLVPKQFDEFTHCWEVHEGVGFGEEKLEEEYELLLVADHNCGWQLFVV